MKEVKISQERLKELEKAERKLEALERGGVDNWEWYGESMGRVHKEDELDSLINTIVEEISVEVLQGAYEPSERGAGYTTGEDNMEQAKRVLLINLEELVKLKNEIDK